MICDVYRRRNDNSDESYEGEAMYPLRTRGGGHAAAGSIGTHS